MQLDFDQLLRYGFSGAFGLLSFAISFDLTNLPATLGSNFVPDSITGLLLPFAVGTFGYCIFRALAFPLLAILMARLNKRTETQIELDFQRWRNREKSGSIQSNMKEWATQVHFLYGSGFTALLLIFLGLTAGLEIARGFYWILIFACLVFAIGGLHHYRHQKWEVSAFREDANLPTNKTTEKR